VNLANFNAAGEGVYAIITYPRSERFDLPVLGCLYSVRLHRQISVRCPKGSVNTDLQCDLQVYTNFIIIIIIIIIAIISSIYSHRQSREYSDHPRLCVILSVCPQDKTKTAETKITKFSTGTVHHDTSPTD